MKRNAFVCLCLSVLFFGAAGTLTAQQRNNSALSLITNHYAAANFIAGSVSRQDLEAIVQAGVRAPSSNNRQPWHFSVVQDISLVRKVSQMTSAPEGTVLIIISTPGSASPDRWEIFDCGFATQSMYLAAQALGYGSRIYTGPTRESVNGTIKASLGIPAGNSAVAVIRIGTIRAGTDAASSASRRNTADSVTTWR